MRSAASPSITGRIGWLPGLEREARSFQARAQSFRVGVQASLAKPLPACTSSSALPAASTIGGGTALEKRYGRERCRNIRTISLRRR